MSEKDPAYPPQHTGYPPQHPAQNPGYPPQDPGYPPQAGYPEQQGSPPQQGYSSQQGYPPQGQAPQAYSGQPPPGGVQYATAPQQTVIMRTGQAGAPPNNYLPFAIFVSICCCLPLGIVAIIKATQVNSKWQAGDQAGAQEASQSAKNFSIVALVIGIICQVIGVVIIVVYYKFVIAVVLDNIDNSDLNLD